MFCYHLYDLWTELTDSSLRGALGCAKEFRIGCSLRFANFPVFVKNTCLMGYGFSFRWSFRIVLFGFRFLSDPSGHYAPPLISNSRETSVCSTCQHRIGSIRVLRSGMWTFIGFDCLACSFQFWSNFFCGFAVVDDFFRRLWGF